MSYDSITYAPLCVVVFPRVVVSHREAQDGSGEAQACRGKHMDPCRLVAHYKGSIRQPEACMGSELLVTLAPSPKLPGLRVSLNPSLTASPTSLFYPFLGM
jgi:hypothetical protein